MSLEVILICKYCGVRKTGFIESSDDLENGKNTCDKCGTHKFNAKELDSSFRDAYGYRFDNLKDDTK